MAEAKPKQSDYANKFLKQDNLQAFLDALQQTYDVFVPVRGKKDVLFLPYTGVDFANIKWDYKLSLYSFKPILMPQKDTLFTFSPEGIKIPTEDRPKAIVGIHLEDLHMLRILDKALLGEHKDVNYARRRAEYFIVGISKTEYHPLSFTPYKHLDLFAGYEFFMQHDADGNYLIVHGSERGEGFTRANPIFEATDQILPEAPPVDIDNLLLNQAKIAEAVEKSVSDTMWDEVSSTCIGCGICTYVCPLCYCFDVKDENSIESGCGERCKTWDSCLSSSFTKVAGGEVFRKDISQRFYNWYHHKFVRMYEELGEVGCTGCGRCIAFCPPTINVKDNLEKVVAKYGSTEPTKGQLKFK